MHDTRTELKAKKNDIVLFSILLFCLGLLTGLYFMEFYFLIHVCKYLIFYGILIILLVVFACIFGGWAVFYFTLSYILGAIIANIYNYYYI